MEPFTLLIFTRLVDLIHDLVSPMCMAHTNPSLKDRLPVCNDNAFDANYERNLEILESIHQKRCIAWNHRPMIPHVSCATWNVAAFLLSLWIAEKEDGATKFGAKQLVVHAFGTSRPNFMICVIFCFTGMHCASNHYSCLFAPPPSGYGMAIGVLG